MKHGSLFTGIGGIDLGFEWAGLDTRWQVEIDPFCNKVLDKHWPTVKRYLDVKNVGEQNLEKVDIISGGFPCQDISIAGSVIDRPGQAKKRGLGLRGSRSGLWREYYRIIQQLRPKWVLVENVARLVTTAAGDTVLTQMEAANYSCWPFVVGANILGAPHERRRVWILCHNNAIGDGDFSHRPKPRTNEVLQEQERKMEEASRNWSKWQRQLGARNVYTGDDSYTGIVRDTHGIPNWVDRLKCLGNAVVPQIPMFFGLLVRQIEGE